ncbi:MAG: hypothetical protein RLZZ536_3528 [Planctomycetota bacterium]|jgi:hypothetical protein
MGTRSELLITVYELIDGAATSGDPIVMAMVIAINSVSDSAAVYRAAAIVTLNLRNAELVSATHAELLASIATELGCTSPPPRAMANAA